MKFKTSTRISIIFSIFNFFIIVVLLVVLNIFLFFSWYNKEIEELRESNIITDILNQTYKEVISDELEKDKLNIFLESMLDLNLFEENKKELGKYKKVFFYIYKKDERKYLIYPKNELVFYSPYDVTDYYNNQLEIIEVGVTLLVFFTFLSFLIAKYLFIKIALRDIYKISRILKNIDLNSMNSINIDLAKNDDISFIVKSINNFLCIIEKNNKSLQGFNSQIAHEFKTPLMVISSELEFLALESGENKSMKRIEYQINKLDSLLSSFLLLTKIQNGKGIKKSKINLSTIIEQNISILTKKYPKKDIIITNKVPTNLKISSNLELLDIIIKNILDNAFKYSNIGGKIQITFHENNLTIKDNGIGIRARNLEKIWDPLYRENEFEEGYGIGLNIVKKITEILGYSISVVSQKKKGTTFNIKFSFSSGLEL